MQEKFSVVIEAVTNGFKSKMNEIKNVGEQTTVRMAQLKREISSLKSEMRGTQPGTQAFKEYAHAVDSAERELKRLSKTNKSISSLGSIFSFIKSKFKGLNPDIRKVTSSIEKMASKAKNSLKKMVLAIIGARSAYLALRKAASSYLSFDAELSDKLSDAWAGLGAQLAPVIEFIINLFAKAVAYINAFVKALTGINMIARANTKALNAQANAAKNTTKSLTQLDEITNISKDKGSGSDVNQIDLPEVSMGDFLENLKEQIEAGDWYGVGETLARKLNESLEKIDWNKIKSKAQNAGKNLARLLNGGIENTDWKLVGGTIAEGLNTAVNFANGFVTTFNFKATGKALANTINGFFEKTDWSKIGDTISKSIAGALDFGISFFRELDGKKMGKSLEKALNRINWDAFGEKLAKLIAEAVPDLFSIGWALIKGISVGFADGITSFIYTATQGFNEWLQKIREHLGIHSPSTVMAEIGKQLIQGLINGIGNIWNKVKQNFEDFKTRMVNKIKEISSIKFNITAKIGANVTEFKNKIKKIFSNEGIIGKVFDWGKGQINQARNWISSLDIGTNYVPEDQLAYIHKGEAVVPKKFNSAEYFSNINNNEETNALLLDVNRTLLDILDKDTTLNINGKELARATYNDFKQEGNRLGGSSVVNVR